MRATHLLLLSLLGGALIYFAVADGGAGPDNCCFKFYPRKVNMKFLRTYFMTDNRCPNAGVILVTTKEVRVCVSPNQTWVQRTMKNLDERDF